jgi:hypothetical protein
MRGENAALFVFDEDIALLTYRMKKPGMDLDAARESAN